MKLNTYPSTYTVARVMSSIADLRNGQGIPTHSHHVKLTKRVEVLCGDMVLGEITDGDSLYLTGVIKTPADSEAFQESIEALVDLSRHVDDVHDKSKFGRCRKSNLPMFCFYGKIFTEISIRPEIPTYNKTALLDLLDKDVFGKTVEMKGSEYRI